MLKPGLSVSMEYFISLKRSTERLEHKKHRAYVRTANSAIALELCDRVVGSGLAQQTMLSDGSDPANPPYQPFELNLLKKITGQEIDIL